MAQKTPEEAAVELFVQMLPTVLAPVINQRQAVIRQLDEAIGQKKDFDKFLDQRLEEKRRELEELGNACAQRGAQLLRISLKMRAYILGEDAPQGPFPAEKLDTVEAFLDEKLGAGMSALGKILSDTEQEQLEQPTT